MTRRKKGKKTMDEISPSAIVVIVLLALGAIVGGGVACASCTKIEPGHVGVSVKK
jgi:hypothetical protein